MYTPELKKIARIQFGILSPEEIRKMAVAQIITPDTYLEDGTPVENGLMDRRLGTIEPGQRCATCGNQVGDCPGHFGVVELARPVLHVGYAKSIIYKLLRSTCRSCAKILLQEELIRSYEKKMSKIDDQNEGVMKRFYKDVAKEARKKTKCPHCDTEQYKIRYEKPTTFYQETPQGPVKLTPKNIADWFSRIVSRHLTLLGINTTFARPEWMVITDLPVPPVSVRASITLESGIKSEDDLTHKLVDIIRINKRLRENIEAGAPQLIVEDLWELLQYHVTTYMDNEVAGIPPARHRSGRALRTLTQRLRGKEGRFRGNLSGKRVDFSARTVISPDPNISINEVGVPEQIAKILTVPEKVTEWNIEEMKELVMNGPADHPGSNYIIRPDTKRIDLRFVGDLEKTAESIEKGFVVERHLRDGDIVLFNRQPSLHRMSIMAHEVKIMPYKTFRLHLCVCTPYNADFDGDEMNLHIPQSEEARAEARTLMRVQEQILSPRYGGPIIGAIHDYITAAHLLTRKGTLIEKEDAWQLLLAGKYEGTLPPPAIAHPKEYWTGKQIFSLLLPHDINITSKSRTCRKCKVCAKEGCDFDDYVVIRKGILHSGTIDRRAIGADEAESVLHVVVRDHGSDRAREFLDLLTQLLLKYLSHLGFSMGISNIILPEDGRNRIKKTVSDSEKNVDKIIKSFEEGTMETLPGKTPRESLEMKIMSELSKARDSAGAVAREYLGMNNTVVVMTSTGARGTPLSITQMSACVGQQSIRGQRILRGYRERTLPHFERGDIKAECRGFVKSNFRDGLNPIEFFFHAQGGREGLVDTAVRTSTSGYLQRRLVNALQDLYVNYDGAVRTAEGEIVQFIYGEDGVDPMRSFHGKAVDVKAVLEDIIGGRPKGYLITDEVNTETLEILQPIIAKYQFPDSIVQDLLAVIGRYRGITEAIATNIIDAVYDSYIRSLAEPGEAVGTVASQSIGEPGTQMSIPGNEKVIIKQGDTAAIVKIGDFIDDMMTRLNSSNVFTSESTSTVCDVPSAANILVPALGADECIHWQKLLQVSRHKPNGDLVKITTRSGRAITATLSHSFVIRKDNQIMPVKGSLLTIGDRIPLVKNLNHDSNSVMNKLALKEYLSPEEVWYGSELQKAAKSVEELGREWKKDFGESYKVPVGPDGLRYSINAEKTKVLQVGFVYSKMQHSENTKIPEELELDFGVGWFIGAYLSEGTNTGTYIGITNVDKKYQDRVAVFASNFNLNSRLVETSGEYGSSATMTVNSTLLATLFTRMCGKGSVEKFVPAWALNAPLNFVSGLLRGYFDGDGNVNVEKSMIRASSNSKELIDGISLLLTRFGIYSSKSFNNNQYWLVIPGKYASKFLETIGSDLAHKVTALETLVQLECDREEKELITYDSVDMIPGFGNSLNDIRKKLNIDGKSVFGVNLRKCTRKQRIGRRTLGRYITKFEELAAEMKHDITKELSVLQRAYNSDVIWDEIVKLELIQSPTDLVYDFTVEGLETFLTADGLITHNTLKTFHFAGVAELNVTIGLPRLIEILDARKMPSSPFMKIFLDADSKDDEAKARDIQRKIELTTIEKVSSAISIDMYTMRIVIELDPELLKDKGIHPDEVLERLKKLKKGELIQPLRTSQEKTNYIKTFVEQNSERAKDLKYVDKSNSETLELLHQIMAQQIFPEDIAQDIVTVIGHYKGFAESLLSEIVNIFYNATYNITFDPNESDIDELYRLHEKIQSLRVKGLKDCGKCIIVREKEEWVLYAEGSNISEVLAIPGVDPTRISTNNIQEILETLGVEAARNAIIKESMSVLREQGLEVDVRHLLLVSDMMTLDGTLRQIGRHGISGEKDSVLAKASFEVTVKHLLESAAYGKLDKLKGITENVIIGQIIPVGTGTVELIMMPGTPAMVQKFTEDEAAYASEHTKPEEEEW